MAKLKVKKGLEANLPAVEDGSLLITTDSKKLYLDNGEERIQVGGNSGGAGTYLFHLRFTDGTESAVNNIDGDFSKLSAAATNGLCVIARLHDYEDMMYFYDYYISSGTGSSTAPASPYQFNYYDGLKLHSITINDFTDSGLSYTVSSTGVRTLLFTQTSSTEYTCGTDVALIVEENVVVGKVPNEGNNGYTFFYKVQDSFDNTSATPSDTVATTFISCDGNTIKKLTTQYSDYGTWHYSEQSLSGGGADATVYSKDSNSKAQITTDLTINGDTISKISSGSVTGTSSLTIQHTPVATESLSNTSIDLVAGWGNSNSTGTHGVRIENDASTNRATILSADSTAINVGKKTSAINSSFVATPYVNEVHSLGGTSLFIKPSDSSTSTLTLSSSSSNGVVVSGAYTISSGSSSQLTTKSYVDSQTNSLFEETIVNTDSFVSSGSTWSSGTNKTYTASIVWTTGTYIRLKIIAAKPGNTSYTMYLSCLYDTTTQVRSVIPFSDIIVTAQGGSNKTVIVGVSSASGLSTTITSISYEIVKIPKIADFVYPVGSIWTGYSYETYPAKAFGGQWTQITDTFLLAAGQTYNIHDEGGEATHTLTTQEMPQHTHLLKFGGGDTDQTIVAGRSYVQSSKWWWSSTDDALIQPSGSSRAHNNMPPYQVVSVWRRVS